MASFKPPIWRLAFPGRVMPLQLQHETASTFIEFVSDLLRVREKCGLKILTVKGCFMLISPAMPIIPRMTNIRY
jgi:hypothetical protein